MFPPDGRELSHGASSPHLREGTLESQGEAEAECFALLDRHRIQPLCRARRSRTASTRSRFGDRDLRGAASRHSLESLMRGGGLGAFDQVLDLHLALGALVAALDDDAGAPRLSAYFICAFMPAVPRYISARMPAWRSVCASLLVTRQLGLIHHQHDDGPVGRAVSRSCRRRPAPPAGATRRWRIRWPARCWPVKRSTRSS